MAGVKKVRLAMSSGKIDDRLNEIYTNALANARLAHVQSQGKEDRYVSGAYGRLSSRERSNIDSLMLHPYKSVYNMLVGVLLYKTVCPDRNIRYWSIKSGNSGWRNKDFDLEGFGKEHVKRFLFDKGFRNAYDPSNKVFAYGALVNSKCYFGNPKNWKVYNRNTYTPHKKYAPFLAIVDDIRDYDRSPEKYLQAIFEVEIYRRLEHERQKTVYNKDVRLRYCDIRNVLDDHLYFDYTFGGKASEKGTSKLPVLMVRSYYETLLSQGATLPLDVSLENDRPATANDRSSDECGDVTLRRPDGSIYECVDVKGNKERLKAHDIVDAKNKILKCGGVETAYYFVYTDAPSPSEMAKINAEIDRAMEELNCDIFVMHIEDFLGNRLPQLPSDSRMDFLMTYRDHIEKDEFGELQDSHRKQLTKILDRYGIARTEPGRERASARMEGRFAAIPRMQAEAARLREDDFDLER